MTTRLFYRGFFLIWALSMMGLVGYLSFLHNSPLHPYQPSKNPVEMVNGEWNVFHLLLADCPCSANVAVYLENRRPSALAHEKIFMIGDNPGIVRELKKASWQVISLTPQEAQDRLGADGGPWLLIYDPQGKLRYSGGYLGRAIHSPSEPFKDIEILVSLKSDRIVQPLASFGCVASEKLRHQFDPLGLKYTSKNP